MKYYTLHMYMFENHEMQFYEEHGYKLANLLLLLQLFSKSVADGMQFYKEHSDKLATSGPTIEFTSQMNSVFDLLNGRRPVEGVRLNSGRDRIKVILCMSCRNFEHA